MFVILLNTLWGYIVFIAIILFVIANLYTYNKIAYNATHMFTTVKRNYKYLIIGDECNINNLVEEEKNYIYFLSPINRTLYANYELIRRLYSLLDEEKGILILVMKKKTRIQKSLCVFDIPYIHEYTLNNLGMGKMKLLCHFPILFSPAGCIKLFYIKKRDSKFEVAECPSKEIIQFCRDRNINLQFKYIK